MPVSKRVRFAVFEAANFTCAYCGRKPPTVILEVDHIQPKSKGGKDVKSNLVCSCFDCNRGKSNHELGMAVPDRIIQNAVEAGERLRQFKALQRYEVKLQKAIEESVEEFENYWLGLRTKTELFDDSQKSIARRLIEKLGLSRCKSISADVWRYCDRHPDIRDEFRYFCGWALNECREKGM